MPLVRALTIFIPVHTWRVEEIVRKAVEMVDKVATCANDSGLKPWTLRVALPIVPSQILECNDFKRIAAETLSALGDRKPLIAFPLDPEHKCVKKLHELLAIENAFFSTMCSSTECIERVFNSVYSDEARKGIELDNFTKFSLTLGSWIETPYFPSAANVSNVAGFAIALRYADAVARAVEGDSTQLFSFLRDVNEKAIAISRCSAVPFLGIDFSLSPWLEESESVAKIVESLLGAPIGSLGTLNVVYNLNSLVRGLPRRLGVRAVGFNEVMLPVAEDRLLSQRVREGFVRVRDLISYSFVCVAGLDMVALPRDTNVLGVIVDMLAVYRVKGRAVAMRVIPTDLDPGTEITLSRFGSTYVARV